MNSGNEVIRFWAAGPLAQTFRRYFMSSVGLIEAEITLRRRRVDKMVEVVSLGNGKEEKHFFTIVGKC